MSILPELFLTRLKEIVPVDQLPGVLKTFAAPESTAIRINLLKTGLKEGREYLADLGIPFSIHPATAEVCLVSVQAKQQLREDQKFQAGALYWQAPSSALPAVVLSPQRGDSVLDLCAAPGSKTTQMAAMMENDGKITAVEAVKARFYRLKSVVDLLGANVKCVLGDGRRLRAPEELFDKVLVDAPCSSEGRFNENDKDSVGYWSQHKIKEMAHKQKGLILSASRLVKPGGVLVYSTCTFAPEENESVVDWFLRKSNGTFLLEPFQLEGVPRYPALASFAGREYKHDVSSCWRVLPDGVFNGFFIAKFRKC